LSKTLRKSTNDVIEILRKAGVEGKNADSNISYDERQILMESLSNR
jgi:translation initiation factor IF-2